MPVPRMTLTVMMSLVFIMSTAASASVGGLPMHRSGESSQLPAGVSDLLAATPTMLSPASTSLNSDHDKSKPKTLRTGNTVTVTGSDIVFASYDKPTLVDTILSMIRNSEPSTVGDDQLSRSIMTVLNAEGSEHENVLKKQLEAVLECRDHEAMLRKCVEALVDVATFDAKERMDMLANERDETQGAADKKSTSDDEA